MRTLLLVLVAAVGVGATLFFAVGMNRAAKSGAPREQVLGYTLLMLAVATVSLLVLRWL